MYELEKAKELLGAQSPSKHYLATTMTPEFEPPPMPHVEPARRSKMHGLKLENPYFQDVANKLKTFEVRHNDRGFKVGDTLCLREYSKATDLLTGRHINAEITYMIDDPRYCKEGFVVLGIRVISMNFDPADESGYWFDKETT